LERTNPAVIFGINFRISPHHIFWGRRWATWKVIGPDFFFTGSLDAYAGRSMEFK
jgi:hypothetical protein